MKELEELKNMVSEVIKEHKPNLEKYQSEEYEDWDEELINRVCEEKLEWFEKFKKYNFLGYNIDSNSATLFETYAEAKNYVERGGQILVIDKDKVYSYKVKTQEEYSEYLRYQIRNENNNIRNKYGI